jgi:hypothetical protein
MGAGASGLSAKPGAMKVTKLGTIAKRNNNVTQDP